MYRIGLYVLLYLFVLYVQNKPHQKDREKDTFDDKCWQKSGNFYVFDS